MSTVDDKPCAFCPDWTAWERDLAKASTRDESPISDEDLARFRHALADVHCKSSSGERYEVEYRLQRFGSKMWRRILARLDRAEADLSTIDQHRDEAPECICPKCGIRHGGHFVRGYF